MTAKWFNIINKNDFLDLDLPSKELELNLTDIGVKTVLVTSGVGVSLVYEGIQLMVGLNDRNPFSFEGHAVYLDSNNDIWLGIEDT